MPCKKNAPCGSRLIQFRTKAGKLCCRKKSTGSKKSVKKTVKKTTRKTEKLPSNFSLADAKKKSAIKKPVLPKTSTSPQKSATKVSITCVKGKKTIKVLALKPTCPSGYKKK